MPIVFVTASSGHIGAKLVPLLLESDNRLVLPTSNANRLRENLSVTQSERVSIVEGSLQDPQWVETQLRTHNVDTVFLCLTGIDELFTTFNIFSALQQSPSVKHIVYLSACGNFTKNPASFLRDWRAAHIVVKLPIELTLEGLGRRFTYTILGPTLFFENDLRQKASIMKAGIYQESFGKLGSSRVSEDDIAQAIGIAVLDQGKKWHGKKIMLGSKKRYTEDDISRMWTAATGKTVHSAGSDKVTFDKLEEHFRSVIDPAWARDLRLMYEGIIEHGFGPSDEEYEQCIAFLGREPEIYDGFVKKVGEGWKQE